MQMILELQKLTVPTSDFGVVAQSCTSSGGSCCNGNQD